jgi:serine/threonine protein kinase
MAPELLSMSSKSAQYSAAVDIYSLGIIINALWRRTKPYDEKDFTGVLQLLQAVQTGHRPQLPDPCPELVNTLMHRCWAAEPGDRISAEEMVQFMSSRIEITRSESGTLDMHLRSTSLLSENGYVNQKPEEGGKVEEEGSGKF